MRHTLSNATICLMFGLALAACGDAETTTTGNSNEPLAERPGSNDTRATGIPVNSGDNLGGAGDADCAVGEICQGGARFAAPPAVPTYTYDIKPIMDKACLSCHASGNLFNRDGAPLDVNLDRYAGVKSNASKSLSTMQGGRKAMPPDPPKYNGPRPTAQEITTFEEWINTGRAQ